MSGMDVLLFVAVGGTLGGAGIAVEAPDPLKFFAVWVGTLYSLFFIAAEIIFHLRVVWR